MMKNEETPEKPRPPLSATKIMQAATILARFHEPVMSSEGMQEACENANLVLDDLNEADPMSYDNMLVTSIALLDGAFLKYLSNSQKHHDRSTASLALRAQSQLLRTIMTVERRMEKQNGGTK
jgi:hypothetical protein